jgi:hypothetical protein
MYKTESLTSPVYPVALWLARQLFAVRDWKNCSAWRENITQTNPSQRLPTPFFSVALGNEMSCVDGL